MVQTRCAAIMASMSAFHMACASNSKITALLLRGPVVVVAAFLACHNTGPVVGAPAERGSVPAAYQAIARVFDDPTRSTCSTDADCMLLAGPEVAPLLRRHSAAILGACTCGLPTHAVRSDTDVRAAAQALDQAFAALRPCRDELLLCDELPKPELAVSVRNWRGEVVEQSCSELSSTARCRDGRCGVDLGVHDVKCADP